MSNSNAFPSQMVPTSSSYSTGAVYGLPPSSQGQSSSSVQSPRSPYRTDSLTSAQQKEDATVPLLSSATGKEVMSDLSIEGIGKWSVAEIAFLLAAVVCVGIPFLLEANALRPKTILEMKRENFEHVIHDAHRGATDVTVKWVRDYEKTNGIEANKINRVASEMKLRIAEYNEAAKAYFDALRTSGHHNDDEVKKLEKTMDAAKGRCDALDLPLDERPVQALKAYHRAIDADKESCGDNDEKIARKVVLHQAKAHCKTVGIADPDKPHVEHAVRLSRSFHPHGALSSVASFLTTLMMHSHLHSIKDRAAKGETRVRPDGDVLRLQQQQAESHIAKICSETKDSNDNLPSQGRAGARGIEARSNIEYIHEQALHGLITEQMPRPSTVNELKAGLDQFGRDLHETALKAPALFEAARKDVQAGKAMPNLTALGFHKSLAEGTFNAPVGPEAIEKFQRDLMANTGKDTKYLYMSMLMRADLLDLIHPGAVDYARHLHPSNKSLSSSGNEDMKKVRVMWRYPLPESGKIHPEPLKLPDGGLFAAWLEKDEPKELKHTFKMFEARNQDRLGGNAHALDNSMVSRVWHGLVYRFHSYGRGTKEGLSSPRFNGMIASNLIVTSIPVSSLLYFVFYGEDYWATKQAEEAKKKNGLPAGSVADNPQDFLNAPMGNM